MLGATRRPWSGENCNLGGDSSNRGQGIKRIVAKTRVSISALSIDVTVRAGPVYVPAAAKASRTTKHQGAVPLTTFSLLTPPLAPQPHACACVLSPAVSAATGVPTRQTAARRGAALDPEIAKAEGGLEGGDPSTGVAMLATVHQEAAEFDAAMHGV
jgi:hypothetical protein